MIQYKLIKEYPGSPKLGTIDWYSYEAVIGNDANKGWKGTEFYERHPEFWEKVEELDYEILGFFNKMNKRVYHFDKASKNFCSIDGFHNNVNYDYCVGHYDIHSVKNLYDGEVFTIRDKVKSKRGTDNDSSLITKIYIDNNRDAKPVGGLIIQTGGYYQAKINEITKVKTPLFSTEDGVAIFEGDDFFFPNTHAWVVSKTTADAKMIHHVIEVNKYKTFSSEEKAEEYVLLNKPCLSLTEISKFYKHLLHFNNGNSMGLRNLVKSKL